VIVKGIGPQDAKIMFVGEAPGREEEISGTPFTGGAGKVLNQFLSQAMITRNNCYITNIMQDRPVNNDFGQFYEDKSRKVPSKFLLEGIERLKKEIENINPNVVVALGNEALRAITGLRSITKYRGSILFSTLVPGQKVIPIIHPAALMRNWDWAPLTLVDLERIKVEAESPTHEFTPRLFHKIESISALETEVKAAIEFGEYLSFDIETCNNQISCIGFATSSTYAFVVPIHMFETSNWSATDEKIIWRLVKKLLESDLKKIGQNVNFDMFFILDTVGIRVNNLWLDTMCAFHCVYPELPKSLAVLCSIYTDQPYYKDMIKTDYYKYNALDSMITLECALKIKEELIEFRTWAVYRNIVHPVLNILLDMESNGVRVNLEKKELATLSTNEEIKALQSKWDKAVGHPLNVNSPVKMSEFLYEELGLPPQYKRTTGKVTTDVKALHRLAAKYPSIVFDYIERLRKVRKVYSTYLTATVDSDNKIRCSYVLYGTESGRLASKMSRFGSGMNLQNVPKGICREMIIPDEGCMFISADLSQAEMRVVAWLANDTILINTFESGEDVFNVVASIVFDIRVEDVTYEQRDLAKHISHACNYGMGPMTLSEISGLSYADSKEKLNSYHINFPRIRMWQMEIEAKLRKVRMLETPMGRRRTFFGRWNNALIRAAYSYIPQSTVSDVILMGMIEMDRRLPKSCKILLNIHDEIVIQAPIEPKRCSVINVDPVIINYKCPSFRTNWVQHIKELMVECMTIPIQINDRILKIPVNTKHGYDWNEVS